MGIECKSRTIKPTDLQWKHLHHISVHGGVALVLNEENVDELPGYLLWLVLNRGPYDQFRKDPLAS